jgi:hypothetical protein
MKFGDLQEKVVARGYADLAKLKAIYNSIDTLLVNFSAKVSWSYTVANVLYVKSLESMLFEPEDVRRPLILESRFYLLEKVDQNKAFTDKREEKLQLTIVR